MAQNQTNAAVCSGCGTPLPDWVTVCSVCGTPVVQPDAALQAELRHIDYVLFQLPGWRHRRAITPSGEAQIRDECRNGQRLLLARLTALSGQEAGALPASAQPFPAPVVPAPPPIPARPNPVPTSLPAAPMPASISGANLAHPYQPPLPQAQTDFAAAGGIGIPPTLPTSSGGDSLRRFFAEHALQIIFALATVLVLAALRTMLGWNWIGVAILPAVPLGLTAMFGLFGQRTREENPWAAFVYHGLAALLIAFDVLAVNKYWLPTPLTAHPAFFVAALAATGAAVTLLLRTRTVPYLHLTQFGALATLYGLLALARGGDVGDFRPVPLPLFGASYLAYAAFCLGIARTLPEFQTAPVSSEPPQPPLHPTTHSLPSNPWRQTWALWSHLSLVALLLVCAANIGLQQAGVGEFALLALLAGLLYSVGAQLLREARMVGLGAGLIALGGAGWLWSVAPARLWSGLDALLLALSAFALSLALYNRRAEAGDRRAEALVDAYRGVALMGVGAAGALTWGAILTGLMLLPDTIRTQRMLTGALMSLLCGAFYAGFARVERRTPFLYAALATWGLVPISLLAALRVGLPVYAFALTLYGALLFLISMGQQAMRPDGELHPVPYATHTVFRICGHISALMGVAIAALLPLDGAHPLAWQWVTGTLLLATALYALTAQTLRSQIAAYAACFCAAYASTLLACRALPPPYGFAEGLAPFMLAAALIALLLNHKIRAVRPAAPTPEGAVPNPPPGLDTAHLWREPITHSALCALIVGLAGGVSAFLFGSAALHRGVTLLPALVAAVLLALSRTGEDENDGVRGVSVGALLLALNLEWGLLCGLTGGTAHWSLPMVQRWALGLCGLGAAYWGLAWIARRREELHGWDRWLVGGGLITAFASQVVLPGASLASGGGHRVDGWALNALASGAFALFACETFRARRSGLLLPLALIAPLTALLHLANRVGLTALPPGEAPVWALLTLAMAAALLWLSRPLDDIRAARAALVPLLAGYGLWAVWETTHTVGWVDTTMTRLLWVIGWTLLAGAFLHTARKLEDAPSSGVAAALLAAAYLRLMTHVLHPGPEWIGLLLLPFLVALAGVVSLRASRISDPAARLAFDRLFTMPLHGCAQAFGLAALAWTVRHGDGLGGSATHANPPIVTFTLLAYGLVYSGVAWARKSARAVGGAACLLSAAYLHHLLTLTVLFAPVYVRSGPSLSGPRFAFLAVLAGVVWTGAAWLLRKRDRGDLAQPLLHLSSGLALGSALIALASVRTPHEGMWSILTLAWAGAVWISLWRMEQGEPCLHFGCWNLLAAWGLVVYDRVGAQAAFLDVYLLPVGLYLLAIGHSLSGRQRRQDATLLWWLGLSAILAPSFLAYWQRTGDGHTVLFLVECVVCVLWGIGQRIRAYVSGGLGAVVLFGAAIGLGRLPDVWGTWASLGLGVTLFVAGFYALTHREQMLRWSAAMGRHWLAWKQWR